MNVTDSLDAIGLEIERARNCLAPAARQLEHPPDPSPPASLFALGRVLDTITILDDVLDIVRREKHALAEAGKLMQAKACAHCGFSFLFAPGAGREPHYCSAACRQRAYRLRITQRTE